jgi:hypothetical protein
LYAFCNHRAQQAKDEFETPFGGLCMFHTGDFLQLPPVLQTSLADPLVPPQSETQECHDKFEDFLSTKGTRLWHSMRTVICLDSSHRAHGVISSVLSEMRQGSISDQSWHLLQSRTIGFHANNGTIIPFEKCDPRLSEVSRVSHDGVLVPSFNSNACRSIVMRHAMRAQLTYDACVDSAKRCGQRLMLSIAVDKMDRLADSESLLMEYVGISSTTTTRYMAGILPLFYGMDVVLQNKVSAAHGLMRGAPGTIMDIIISSTDMERWENDPTLPPFILTSLPIVDVMVTSGVEFETQCGVNRFLVSPSKASISWKRPSTKVVYNFQRTQLLLLPAYVHTHYSAQGLEMITVKADLHRPPTMSISEHWLACYVILSRCIELEGLLLWRLCDRKDLNSGPPPNLQEELERLDMCQTETLKALSTNLMSLNISEAKFYGQMIADLSKVELAKTKSAQKPCNKSKKTPTTSNVFTAFTPRIINQNNKQSKSLSASCGKVLGDGRCMFRALVRGQQLSTDRLVPRDSNSGLAHDPGVQEVETYEADALRSIVCDAMEEDPHLLYIGSGTWDAPMPLIEGDTDSTSYIADMRNFGTHAGEAELFFSAQILYCRVEVWIWEATRKEYVCIRTYVPDLAQVGQSIPLLYNGTNHYDLMHVGFPSHTPSSQIRDLFKPRKSATKSAKRRKVS